MKKLILLAVVVFGFAAMSFAQTQANGGIFGTVTPFASPNAGLKIGSLNNMNFGPIANAAIGTSTIRLKVTGVRTVDVGGGAIISGSAQLAQFSIEGAMQGQLNLDI